MHEHIAYGICCVWWNQVCYDKAIIKCIYTHSAKIFLPGYLTFQHTYVYVCVYSTCKVRRYANKNMSAVALNSRAIFNYSCDATDSRLDWCYFHQANTPTNPTTWIEIHVPTLQHSLTHSCMPFYARSEMFPLCRRLSSQRLSSVARCWAVVVIAWRNCAICRLWLFRVLQKTNCLHPRLVIH